MKKFVAPVHMQRGYKHGHWYGWFFIPTWRANIHLLWPVNSKQVTAYIKRNFDLDYSPGLDFGGKCVEVLDKNDNEVAQVICLREWKDDECDVGILAHEAFHAAEHILSNRGITLSTATTEPFAYLIQEIVDRSLQIIRSKPR